MLTGMESAADLGAVARARTRDYETRTVHPALAEEHLQKGWVIDKKNRKSVRLRRAKPTGRMLEDRVWSLLFRVGFPLLSGPKGCDLLLSGREPEGPRTQIDVVGLDDEIALAIECKAQEKPGRRGNLIEEIGKLSLVRERLAHAANVQYKGPHKRQVVLAMFLDNAALSDNDRARAKDANVVLFDSRDLSYYETLVSHLGSAAKYQFFADMLPGKTVPGLEIRVPATRTKMGGHFCYTFSISPEYLLKISYVSHRSKGKASDVNTYQRMLKKSRLNSIRDYIAADGIFPTNIVLNLESKRMTFDRAEQRSSGVQDQEAGLLGWLNIKPAYKSAWIIDGQHRLFAYSGQERAASSKLAVLAFEGLPASKQAQLFIDINAKQKSVKRSLLNELYAELHWDAEEPQLRVRAIISKAIQELDADPTSPLCGTVQMADADKDEKRCITLTGLFGALEKPGLYIAEEKKGHILRYGALWDVESSEATLRRTVYVISGWLEEVKRAALDWWERGSGDGGGLAMNDGVASCIGVLRSVVVHLEGQGRNLVRLDNEDLMAMLKPFGESLGRALATYNSDERRRFRELRGVQGVTTRTRRLQSALRVEHPKFAPEGLDLFLETERAQTNLRAKEVIDRIETTVQRVVMDELRREFGEADSEWWLVGVPKNVRLKVTARFEEDDGKRGGKEFYFDLIDYRSIAKEHWKIFEGLLGIDGTGKDRGTSWLNVVNDKRRSIAHPSSGVTLPVEDLSALVRLEEELRKRLSLSAPAVREEGALEE